MLEKILASSLIGAFFLGLFWLAHKKRKNKISVLEITPNMIDPQKGLHFYFEESLNFFKSLRYQILQVGPNKWRLSPTPRHSVVTQDIEITKDALILTITGPDHSIRMLKSILDLERIFS
jgi:hypothetical protein